MKTRFLPLALAAALSILAPVAILAATLDLPAGTQLNVTTDTTLDSSNAQVGDTFTAHVQPPYPPGDDALAGAVITGHVTKVQRAGQGTKPEIDINFDRLQLSDGSSAPINAVMTQAQPKTQQKNAARVAAATIGGMLLGNAVAKTVLHTSDHGVAGTVGALGGFLYANNTKTNVQFPAGSQMAVRMQSGVSVRPQAR